MPRYAHVDAADGLEFLTGEPSEDPNAAPGQYQHLKDGPQFVVAADLLDFKDALDDKKLLKVGWYDLDTKAYLGTTRPDPNAPPPQPSPENPPA